MIILIQPVRPSCYKLITIINCYLETGLSCIGTTFSIIYQIKAYYLSYSETFVSVAASRGDLRTPHVSMATNMRLIIQINGTIEMKMHFSCNNNSRKNFQHLMML